jgi:hypothetical protein
MITLVLLLAFSREMDKDASAKLCNDKPWLCESLNCPKENEERIDEVCHCRVGYTRNPKTKVCEPLF